MDAMNQHLAAFLRDLYPISAVQTGEEGTDDSLAAPLDGLDVTELDVEVIFAV